MFRSTLTTLTLLTTTGMAVADSAPMSFDVAEDISRFVFASEPVFENGLPAFGNAFVTQGYIYEDGTLDGGAEGTLADGAPAFPDKVIGRWTCDGYFVGEGAQTTTGAMVITRQVFEFDNGDVLINQGAELADVGAVAPRAITGGTGSFASFSGEMTQVLLGMTDGYGVRLSIDIPSSNPSDLRKRKIDKTDHTEWDSGFPVGPLDQG